MQLPVKQQKVETDEMAEVVECPLPLSCSPSKPTTQKPKTRKIKNADFIAEIILLKKRSKHLSELEKDDLHMKRINFNVNKNK